MNMWAGWSRSLKMRLSLHFNHESQLFIGLSWGFRGKTDQGITGKTTDRLHEF